MTWLYAVEVDAENASTAVEHACRKAIVDVIIPRSQPMTATKLPAEPSDARYLMTSPNSGPLPIPFPDNSTNTSVSSKHPSCLVFSPKNHR